MNPDNKVFLNWKDNPDLRDALAGKKAGDKCSVELTVTVDEVSEDGLTASIEDASVDGYESEPAPEPAEEAPKATPVALVIAKKKHETV